MPRDDLRKNELGQPIGRALPDWAPARPPERTSIEGRLCRLEPLDAARHAGALYAAYREDRDGGSWTYLPYGPFASEAEYRAWVSEFSAVDDLYFFAIVQRESRRPVGVASYLRVAPEIGSIEVGHLSYSPTLKRTPVATEAMYLMMRRVFEDWGYRRYEWKCDSLNAPSRAAARRLGFRYEGTFRNQTVMKGRNRDTAWFSILDEEWPGIRDALERWLDPGNFDRDGRQRERLEVGMPDSAGEALALDV